MSHLTYFVLLYSKIKMKMQDILMEKILIIDLTNLLHIKLC